VYRYCSIPQSVSLLLYTWVITYVILRTVDSLTLELFNFIFWIIVTLMSINVVMRSMSHDVERIHLLRYQLVDPMIAYVSRLIFNILYFTLTSLSFYLCAIFFFYPIIEFQISFVGVILTGAVGIAGVLSFTSALARKEAGHNTSLSVLSIPILIPLIIILHNIGDGALQEAKINNESYLILLGITLLSIALSVLLFPHIWKD